MDGQMNVWMDEQMDVHAGPCTCRQTDTHSLYMDTEHWVDRWSRRSQTETVGDSGMILLEFSLVEDYVCVPACMKLICCTVSVWFVSNEQF